MPFTLIAMILLSPVMLMTQTDSSGNGSIGFGLHLRWLRSTGRQRQARTGEPSTGVRVARAYNYL
jgi:hypothetical protein